MATLAWKPSFHVEETTTFAATKLRLLLPPFAGDDVVNRERHERRRAQVDCARLVLDRSAALLLTSSKGLQKEERRERFP